MLKKQPLLTSSRTLSATLLAATALLAAGTSSVYAANDLWIGNTDANFATLSNWTGSVNPSGNTPQFGVAGSSLTTLNNDLSGATFVGLTFNSGASAFIIEGNSFTLNGGITNSSSSLQTINTGMTIASGNRTLAGGAGGLTLGGTITHTQTSATFAGVVITGTVNSTGTFTENGGAINGAGYLSIGGANTLNVTAGTFSILGTTNAGRTLSSIGQNAAGTSNLNVSGGNLVIGANTGFALANASTGTGVLTISSAGTATINRGTVATTSNGVDTRLIMMGRAPTSANGNTGIINLNGGTLATDRQFVRNGSSGGTAGIANFVFGGGTLKALGTQTDWLQSTTATSEGQNQGATGGTVNTNALELTSVTTTAVSTIDANGFSVAINSAISGAGGFNINSSTGTGTVTFGGTNTYTGATTINAGTLQISGTGDINASSGITINGSGAKLLQTSSTAGTSPITLTQGTLDGTGAVGAVTVGNGTGGIVTNGNGGTSTLTVASLAFGGAGTINLNKADDTFTPALAIDGAFTTTPANGQISLNLLTAPPIWTNGSTYKLISYGSFNGVNTNFTLGTISGLGGRQSATLGNTGAGSGFITLAIAGDTPVWTGAANANWTTTAQPSPFNWKLQTAGTGTQFLTNDQVLFNDAATGTTAINIANASVSPVSVVFNNSSKNYSISSTGGFGIATGSLLKGGTGSLTLNTSNTYSGGTTLNDGTLNINNASAIGTGTLTIAAGTTIDNTSGSAVTLSTNNAQSWNGDFTFGGSNDLNLGAGAVTLGSTVYLTTNGTGTLTVGGVIGGAGFGINKEGSGTLALNGANTFGGGVVIDAGTVRIGNAAALGTSTNSLTFGTAAGARLQVNGNAVTVGGIDGDNTATIENSNATHGALTVNTTSGSSFGGTVQDGSAGTLALAKSGSGTLTLTGTNTYSGGTTLNAGTLSVGGTSALGTGTVTVNGGAISSSSAAVLSNAFILNSGITFNATNDTLALNGAITGTPTGNMVLNPTNLITLGGINNLTFSSNFGGLLINNGFGIGGVAITGSTTINGNAANTQSGYLGLSGDTTVTVQSGGSLTINGTTNANKPLSVVGQNAAGTSNLNVSGGNLVIGTDTGLALGNGSTGTGVLTISSGTATINRGTLATTTNGVDTRLILMGRDGTGAGIVNLNGGTLATDRQFVSDGSNGAGSGTANFVFGGGTLKALGTQTDWLQSTTASSEGQNQGDTGGTVNTGALALSSVTTTAVSMIDSNGFSVAINSDISGAGGFNINSSTGTGTVTFGGTNSYTGATTVNAGTLLVSVSISGSAATVSNSGSTLGGTGTVGAVTVNSAAILQGGSGAASGALSSGGDVSLLDGSIIKLALGASNTHSSLLRTGGTWSFDSDQAFSFISAQAGSFDNVISGLSGAEANLITGGSAAWNFSDASWNYAFTYDGAGGVDLAVIAVPEPGSAISLVGGFGMLLGLRRFRRQARAEA